jgi:diacylglycerol kinase (ATP)
MNPVAGNAEAETLREVIDSLCSRKGWQYEIYETTGEEDVAEVARKAAEEGADLIVAAGGDGTVAGVVNGLVGSKVPVGVAPMGTGNGLARAMDIPLDILEALEVIAGEHEVQEVDVMKVGDQHFVLNVSAGLSARGMKETPAEEKQRLGMLAYAKNILQDAVQTEPLVFNLTLDNHQVQVQATEVLLSNGVVLEEPVLFGSREKYSDGSFDVNILTAASPTEFVRLAWDVLVNPDKPKESLRDLTVKERFVLDVEGEPVPVQADGEVIGETPVEVQVLPHAVRIVVPKRKPEEPEPADQE